MASTSGISRGGPVKKVAGAPAQPPALPAGRNKPLLALEAKKADVVALVPPSLPAAAALKGDALTGVQPAEIDAVAQSNGWAEDSWQVALMRSADANALSEAGQAAADGQTSVREVRAYIDNPVDLMFLASSALAQLRATFDANGGEPIKVNALEGWQKVLARQAKKASPEGGSTLSVEELDAYLNAEVKYAEAPAQQWLPNQKLDVMLSCIAIETGEVDHLRPKGVQTVTKVPHPGNPERERVYVTIEGARQYMRIAYDPIRRIPRWVSFTVHACDLNEVKHGIDPKRTDNWIEDKLLEAAAAEVPELAPAEGAKALFQLPSSAYDGKPFDQAHAKAADTAPTDEAMVESFLRTNRSPHTPELNRQSWRMLEAAAVDLVREVNGHGVFIIGNMFLDGEGDPLPSDEVQWMGDPETGAAIPTHVFLSCLLTQEDGSLSMFTYILPNTDDLPTKKEDILPWIQEQRGSVDLLERSFKENFWWQLPKDEQRRLEKTATPLLDPFEKMLAARLAKEMGGAEAPPA